MDNMIYIFEWKYILNIYLYILNNRYTCIKRERTIVQFVSQMPEIPGSIIIWEQ